MQSPTEFIERKILKSSASNKYLECLITLQRELIYTLKSKRPKTHPCGTPPPQKKTSKGKEKVSKMRAEYCRVERQLRYQFT